MSGTCIIAVMVVATIGAFLAVCVTVNHVNKILCNINDEELDQ